MQNWEGKDIHQRVNAYTTSDIKPIEITYFSPQRKNYTLPEMVVFQRLKQFRIVHNREFFQAQKYQAILVVDEVNRGVITEKEDCDNAERQTKQNKTKSTTILLPSLQIHALSV